MTRINKYIADCGLASRRAAEDFIRAGKVKVNGETVTNLGFKVSDGDKIEVNGKPAIRQPELVYIILNKPAGVVTTCSDQFNRKTVLDLLGNIDARVFPVGRLDYATEGLLILTNDGEFARKVTHPSSEIRKTYVATLNKPVTQNQLNQLSTGVGYNAPINVTASQNTATITISEGRNRQVRKMFEEVGLRVTHLKRISIGNLTLGKLNIGEWRYLTTEEIVCFFKKLIIS